MREMFRIMAERAAALVGSHWAFLLAAVTVLAWAVTGPYFAYLATIHQYRYDDRHIPDGLPYPEHAEPRKPLAWGYHLHLML